MRGKDKTMYEKFLNLYPVSKTLKFKLIPIGKTEENIRKASILQNDLKRANDYVKMKKLMPI